MGEGIDNSLNSPPLVVLGPGGDLDERAPSIPPFTLGSKGNVVSLIPGILATEISKSLFFGPKAAGEASLVITRQPGIGVEHASAR